MNEGMKSVISYARNASPYFKSLYSELPDDVCLEDLPLVDHAAYWIASSESRKNVMTSPQFDGVVMKTGGTTARPKTTAYSQIELQRTTNLLANGLLAGGVRAGDRVANMFYAGDLYGSFLLHVLSIMSLPVPVVHLPIGGLTGIAEAVSLVDQCEATVVLTTATSLVKMALYITATGQPNELVRCALFGGEPLFPEQEKVIRAAFPQASIRSCIYGTVDAGVLAMAAEGYDNDTRVHQAFNESVTIEIFQNDETNQRIEENGIPGMLVATNAVRQLCPVIRYPTGDQASWVDKDKGVFRLLGRASQAVRLGPVSIDMVDVQTIVARCMPSASVQGVQAVLTRVNGLDRFECVIATQVEVGDAARAIEDELYLQRPMYKQHVDLGLVAPLAVRFVGMEQLLVTSGSHKLMEIVEKRFDTPPEKKRKLEP